MAIQPKTAIACRDDIEFTVCLDILKKEGHTTDLMKYNLATPIRIYVCPREYDKYRDDEHDDLEYNIGAAVDDYEYIDEDDNFEWNYVEASDILRNQIISARIKGGHNVT